MLLLLLLSLLLLLEVEAGEEDVGFCIGWNGMLEWNLCAHDE
jgi:hypothetical protein